MMFIEQVIKLFKRKIKIMNIKSSAQLSPCKDYRYALWRIWDEDKPYALFICLNPSTADENKDDPTLVRCIKFAQSWGYGGLCMGNLFAYRATQPKDLIKSSDPIGAENDYWLEKLSRDAGIVIVGWGNHGSFLNRSNEVLNRLSKTYCLKKNKSGQPSHPLYINKNLKPILFSEF